MLHVPAGTGRTHVADRPTELIINVRARDKTKVVKIQLRKIRNTRVKKVYSPGIPEHDW